MMLAYESIQKPIIFSRTRTFRVLFIFGLAILIYTLIRKTHLAPVNVSIHEILVSRGKHGISNLLTMPRTNITTIHDSSTTITGSEKMGTTKSTTNKNQELTNESWTIQKPNVTQQPKEAFVTFSNNNPRYLALLKILLDSIHAFSTRPIIAFGIDIDLDIDTKQYPRLIKRRLQQKDCGWVRWLFPALGQLSYVIDSYF